MKEKINQAIEKHIRALADELDQLGASGHRRILLGFEVDQGYPTSGMCALLRLAASAGFPKDLVFIRQTPKPPPEELLSFEEWQNFAN